MNRTQENIHLSLLLLIGFVLSHCRTIDSHTTESPSPKASERFAASFTAQKRTPPWNLEVSTLATPMDSHLLLMGGEREGRRSYFLYTHLFFDKAENGRASPDFSQWQGAAWMELPSDHPLNQLKPVDGGLPWGESCKKDGSGCSGSPLSAMLPSHREGSDRLTLFNRNRYWTICFDTDGCALGDADIPLFGELKSGTLEQMPPDEPFSQLFFDAEKKRPLSLSGLTAATPMPYPISSGRINSDRRSGALPIYVFSGMHYWKYFEQDGASQIDKEIAQPLSDLVALKEWEPGKRLLNKVTGSAVLFNYQLSVGDQPQYGNYLILADGHNWQAHLIDPQSLEIRKKPTFYGCEFAADVDDCMSGNSPTYCIHLGGADICDQH